MKPEPMSVEGFRPIWGLIRTWLSPETCRADGPVAIWADVAARNGLDVEALEALAELFNRGDRWIPEA